MIRSPCTNVCVIEPATGLCRGCYRTLDEIADWSGIPDAGKRAILRNVARRRAAARDGPGGW